MTNAEIDAIKWKLGDIHPLYGEVVMMGTTGGERYRWFQKDNVVSMIPLSFLIIDGRDNDNARMDAKRD